MKMWKMQENPTPWKKSYTQPYTGNCQILLGFSISGVGNVGYFYKTFFVGCRNVLYMKAPEEEKHRTSLHKTSVLLRQNLRTFAQRSPMFCIFRTVLFCIIRTAIFPPQKKFFENLLHFLHPYLKYPVFIEDFGCRIGCRIRPLVQDW